MLTCLRRHPFEFARHLGLRHIGLPSVALILFIVSAWSSPQPAWAEGIDVHGSVLETLDTSSYTYVRVKTGDSEELWVAAPRTSVRVGTSKRSSVFSTDPATVFSMLPVAAVGPRQHILPK